jgi:hypothetical protein
MVASSLPDVFFTQSKLLEHGMIRAGLQLNTPDTSTILTVTYGRWLGPLNGTLQ